MIFNYICHSAPGSNDGLDDNGVGTFRGSLPLPKDESSTGFDGRVAFAAAVW